MVLASISAKHLLSVWMDRLVLRVLLGKGLPSGLLFPSLNTKSLSENQDVGKNELNASQMKECQVMLGFFLESEAGGGKRKELSSHLSCSIYRKLIELFLPLERQLTASSLPRRSRS